MRQGSGLPTAAIGLISEPFRGELILATGQADAILVGREYLRDPNFAQPIAQHMFKRVLCDVDRAVWRLRSKTVGRS